MDAASIQKPRPRRRLAWRIVRVTAISAACLATLIAMFYTEENWRGKRAWDQFKKELLAKGEMIEWSALIPPPVPDEKNFFKAPGIAETDWQDRGEHDLAKSFSKVLLRGGTNSQVLGEAEIVSPGRPDAVSIDASIAPSEVRKWLANELGKSTVSALGFSVIAKHLDRSGTARIRLAASKPLTALEVGRLFHDALAPFPKPGNWSEILVKPAATNAFTLTFSIPPVSAAEWLKQNAVLDPDIDSIREALQRPFARMAGDYSEPLHVPIPNFITLRTVAQTLSDRAKCHLLLDEPDMALRDLTLLHELASMLEARPTGQPTTLLASMIAVAITGLYVDTIADGFRLGCWQEPQFAPMQQQLSQTYLIPIVTRSFMCEQLYETSGFEKGTLPAESKGHRDIFKVWRNWWEMMRDPSSRFLALSPRGWIYRNMINLWQLPANSEVGDVSNAIIYPQRARARKDALASESPRAPYSYLCAILIPNTIKAWQKTAHQQTRVNEALIACALERYHIANHSYPETLDALVPRFAEKLPHDLIGGGPLHYRRTNNGSFVLYSIGWNEKDDGGKSELDGAGNESEETGDWVWRAVQNE